MTRTDAFSFAIKKVLEAKREFIDGAAVKSLQITVSLNKDGQANINMTHRTEDTVIGCFDGVRRLTRYDFST